MGICHFAVSIDRKMYYILAYPSISAAKYKANWAKAHGNAPANLPGAPYITSLLYLHLTFAK